MLPTDRGYHVQGRLAVRRRFIALILVFGFSLLSVLVVTPASAQIVPSITVDSATLVAKGAAVDVGMTATCESGGTRLVYVGVTQRVGKRVAQGYGANRFALPCGSSPEPITVRVTATAGGLAFTNDAALVNATATICDSSGFCQDIETSQAIKIKIKKK